LASGALKTMRSPKKSGIVCFTNPADRCAYIIPIQKIDERVKSSEWKRSEIEVNIDHENTRWRELNWDIEEYYLEL
jgi:hypothetical protein